MRGTLDVLDGRHPDRGIIPAYAGNTTWLAEPRQPKRDHPRICGEHFRKRGMWITRPGSSPHMRGTLIVTRLTLVRAGIIPAYAGNTFSARSWTNGGRDHPRICGEHRHSQYLLQAPRGSSPHMRGTPAIPLNCERLTGIIPAYAGNTVHCRDRPERNRDHPRICGEHRGHLRAGDGRLGSSPHMRGTRAA